MVLDQFQPMCRRYPDRVSYGHLGRVAYLEMDAEYPCSVDFRSILGSRRQDLATNFRSWAIHFEKNSKNKKIFLCIREKMGYNKTE